jgi:hypothetical protein
MVPIPALNGDGPDLGCHFSQRKTPPGLCRAGLCRPERRQQIGSLAATSAPHLAQSHQLYRPARDTRSCHGYLGRPLTTMTRLTSLRRGSDADEQATEIEKLRDVPTSGSRRARSFGAAAGIHPRHRDRGAVLRETLPAHFYSPPQSPACAFDYPL